MCERDGTERRGMKMGVCMRVRQTGCLRFKPTASLRSHQDETQ